MNQNNTHSFHIPVMGTGFTIDTPIKLAHYGISSVVSLVDDHLIEEMRKYYSDLEGECFSEITSRDKDSRARRITEYLNLVNRIVQRKSKELRESSFKEGSEITRYYELLPENSTLKLKYLDFLRLREELENTDVPEPNQGVQLRELEKELREWALPGSIDVNIMTKLNCEHYEDGEKLGPEFSDALAALRGYAESEISSSVVFSAGLNPQLYNYIAKFEDFIAQKDGLPKKKIIIKVSDYRSALVQGKILAKKGLWVSEFRVESGINCGGHAFVSKGTLLGPVLEEFKSNRKNLKEELKRFYLKASKQLKPSEYGELSRKGFFEIKVSAQGGIGTAEENSFLLEYYGLDSTGWGSPFLLVPEATSVDPEHLEKLINATQDDVHLSPNSPMGTPIWNLKDSESEHRRLERIAGGVPGSPCVKGFLKFNTEFTEKPICTASLGYQKKKLEEIDSLESLSDEEKSFKREQVLSKSCICNDLAGSALLDHELDSSVKPFVCSGPNIINFSKLFSLEEMLAQIYGKAAPQTPSDRPNLFLKELSLYLDYLKEQFVGLSKGFSDLSPEYFEDFLAGLQEGIKYYQKLSSVFFSKNIEGFNQELEKLSIEVELFLSQVGQALETPAVGAEGVSQKA